MWYSRCDPFWNRVCQSIWSNRTLLAFTGHVFYHMYPVHLFVQLWSGMLILIHWKRDLKQLILEHQLNYYLQHLLWMRSLVYLPGLCDSSIEDLYWNFLLLQSVILYHQRWMSFSQCISIKFLLLLMNYMFSV